MHGELAVHPFDGRGMQLDRIVVQERRRVGLVDAMVRGGQRLLGVADLEDGGLAEHGVRMARLGPGGGEIGDGRLGFIGHRDEPRRVVGLLLRLGQHDGHRLAVPVHGVVLHDGQVAAGHAVALAERFRRLHPRRVAMGHHQGNAGRQLGGRRIQAGDAAARDRRMHDSGVEQPLHRDLGGKARLAAHFQRAVEPRHRHADMAVLPVSRRRRALRPRAGHQGVGHMAQHRAQDPGHAHARPPVGLASWLRTATIVRFASSTLNALSRRTRAEANSPSEARRNTSSDGCWPRRRASATSARQGLWATPPSASRTSLIVPSSISRAAATETRAKA